MPRNHGIGARARGFVLGSIFLVTATISSLVAPTVAAAAARENPVVRGSDAAALGNALLDWTNAIRRRHGLRALRMKACVVRYAGRHSDRMADRRRLFHSTASQLVGALDGANWSTIGENVGMGATLRRVERAFLRSSEHRENLLNRRFDHMGMGVVVSRGDVWVTSVFYG